MHGLIFFGRSCITCSGAAPKNPHQQVSWNVHSASRQGPTIRREGSHPMVKCFPKDEHQVGKSDIKHGIERTLNGHEWAWELLSKL